MKISLRTILWFAGALSVVCNPCALAHTDVTVAEARDLIASRSDLTVADVREPYEYCDARGHILGALNYPWSSGVLRTRYEELPAEGPILVVCRSGGRSNAAASFLDSKGFSEVYDMLRGMNAWQWETAPCKYSGGSGTAEDPYQIATAEDLIALGETPEDYDKHFTLTADIDLDPNLPGRRVFDRAVIAPDVNDDENGFQGVEFTGVVFGNGHAISHMVIEGASYLGLFGRLGHWDSEGEVLNLGLDAIHVSGTGDQVGGLAGSTRNTTISNCYSTGSVSGGNSVGGLVGYNNANITSSCATGAVRGMRDVGGFVGSNGKSGRITDSHADGTSDGQNCVGGLVGSSGGIVMDSYSMGTVTGVEGVGGLIGCNDEQVIDCHSTCSVAGETNVGGLAGTNWRIDSDVLESSGIITGSFCVGDVIGTKSVGGFVGRNDGHVTASYSTGAVTGAEYVGGFVGMNQRSTANCYSRGDVTGNIYVGGFAGGNQWTSSGGFAGLRSGSIIASYSTGKVTGETAVGGLVGFNQSGGIITASFWEIETSNEPNMCVNPEDPNCDNSYGKTTAEMQTATTFLEAGWDFMGEVENGPNDIWWILEGRDYPKLWWEYPGHIFEIEIALGADFEDPEDPNDMVYEFELTVVTDASVQRLEFVTPSGSLFEIPNLQQHEVPVPGGWLETAWEYDDEAGIYEWSYEMKLDDPNGLADFADGNYEIVTYYEDATRQQTAPWFGIPGTDEPIPQPAQEPVMTSFSDGDVLAPPVAVEWKAPTDPAINQVLVSLARQDAPEWLDFALEKDAAGIGQPVLLSEGPWAADLVFATRYSYKNADKVQIECIKYTESGYTFTVAP